MLWLLIAKVLFDLELELAKFVSRCPTSVLAFTQVLELPELPLPTVQQMMIFRCV